MEGAAPSPLLASPLCGNHSLHPPTSTQIPQASTLSQGSPLLHSLRKHVPTPFGWDEGTSGRDDSLRKVWKEHRAFSLEKLGWGRRQNMVSKKATKPATLGPTAPDTSLQADWETI